MIRYRTSEFLSAEIWRVFISGSSSSGKTYFAKQLLMENFFDYERIFYYHPDISETFPVKWQDLNKPIVFQAGLPSKQELLEAPPKTCIVLDDLFTEASKSEDISYLFRVLSSKKELHLIIMTQRYFAEKGLNIRNCSNFHVLMNNVDVRTNARVGNQLGLKEEFRLAEEANKDKRYPYIFLDRTNDARVTKLQVFTDIFSRYIEVIYNRMRGYILSEADFKASFNCLAENFATRKNETQKSKRSSSTSRSKKKKENTRKSKTGEPSTGATDRIKQKRAIQREVRATLHRLKKQSELQREIGRVSETISNSLDSQKSN